MHLPPTPSAHTTLLAIACFLGTSVYAFMALFAAVIMPGLASLDDDADYLRAFQAIDGTIQNNQPLFVASWMGSMVVAIALALVAFRKTYGVQRVGMVVSCLLFLVGHVITVSQHLPRNNRLHNMDIANANEEVLASMRQDFETSWCYFNTWRTVLFGLASMYWIARLVYDEPPVATSKSSFDTPPDVEARFQQVV